MLREGLVGQVEEKVRGLGEDVYAVGDKLIVLYRDDGLLALDECNPTGNLRVELSVRGGTTRWFRMSESRAARGATVERVIHSRDGRDSISTMHFDGSGGVRENMVVETPDGEIMFGRYESVDESNIVGALARYRDGRLVGVTVSRYHGRVVYGAVDEVVYGMNENGRRVVTVSQRGRTSDLPRLIEAKGSSLRLPIYDGVAHEYPLVIDVERMIRPRLLNG